MIITQNSNIYFTDTKPIMRHLGTISP